MNIMKARATCLSEENNFFGMKWMSCWSVSTSTKSSCYRIHQENITSRFAGTILTSITIQTNHLGQTEALTQEMTESHLAASCLHHLHTVITKFSWGQHDQLKSTVNGY